MLVMGEAGRRGVGGAGEGAAWGNKLCSSSKLD